MTAHGRPKAELVVSGSEREALKRLARQPSMPQAIAERVIVLACADGQTNTAVADRLGVSGETVGKWRRGFVELRIDGLVDASRPGQPRKEREACDDVGVGQPAADATEHSITGQPHVLRVRAS